MQKAALLMTVLVLRASAALASAVLVSDPRMTRMVALSRSGGCAYFTDRSTIRQMVLQAPKHQVREDTPTVVDELMDACRRRSGGSGFLYPGTKWCGPGTTALSYNDLGALRAEDACCRDHDHCPLTLAPGECNKGVCNSSPFTRSHCNCDARFRRCLQTVNSAAAHTLGAVFFNVARITCFKERRVCPGSARDQEQEQEGPCIEWQMKTSGRYSPLPPIL